LRRYKIISSHPIGSEDLLLGVESV